MPKTPGRPRKKTSLTTTIKETSKEKKNAKNINYVKDSDGKHYKIPVNQEPKKRGRKPGITSINNEPLFRAEDVLDFLHINYPKLGIDIIRDYAIYGIKKTKKEGKVTYKRYKTNKSNGEPIYYTTYGLIFNTLNHVIGIISVFKSPSDGKITFFKNDTIMIQNMEKYNKLIAQCKHTLSQYYLN